MSSSVEVEKMKIERSEVEASHMVDLRAIAPLRSQIGKYDKGGVGSHDAIKLLSDENVELIKVTLRSPALMRLVNNR